MKHALTATLLLCATVCRADVIPEGYRPLQHQVRVEGMEAEPLAGYRFFVYPTMMGSSYRELKAGEDQYFKWTQPLIYALTAEQVQALPDPDDRDAQAAFFAREELPRSAAKLELIGNVPEDDPRVKVRTRWRIDAVEERLVRVTRFETVWGEGDEVLSETETHFPPRPKSGEPDQDGAGAPTDGDAAAQPTERPASSGGCALTSSGSSWPLLGLSGLALLGLVLLAGRGRPA